MTGEANATTPEAPPLPAEMWMLSTVVGKPAWVDFGDGGISFPLRPVFFGEEAAKSAADEVLDLYGFPCLPVRVFPR